VLITTVEGEAGVRLALGFNPVLKATEAPGLAARVEALGFDSVWIHESLFQRDVVTYVSSMASATKKIRLSSGVINTFTRHPVTAATTFATLAELSGGRVILGLGLGSFPTVPLLGYQIFPVEKTRPLRRVKEYVEVVKLVLSGQKVEFEGEFFRVHNLTLGFQQQHRVPLFIASLSKRTLTYAPSVADGVILSPAFNTVWGTERMIEHVKAGERAKGAPVERASYMMTSVDPDRKKSLEVLRDYYFFVYQLAEVVRPEVLAPYGIDERRLEPMKAAWKKGDVAEAKRLIPEEAIEALTISGDADHALERVREYTRVGVTLPILMPIGNTEYALKELAPGAG
jgi:5,10-methylenetetrahydromethanopterin reductase